MIITQKYECEICSKEFEKPYEVRDEISVLNGADTRGYAYVCAPCIKKFNNVIDEAFPKNKFAVRIREAAEAQKLAAAK